MNSGELFPIMSGLLLGLVVGLIRLQSRRRAAWALTGLFGFLATLFSGELPISWIYLPMDLLLVAISALTSFLLSHWVGTMVQRAFARDSIRARSH